MTLDALGEDDFLQFASKLPTGSNGVTVPRLCDFDLFSGRKT